MRRWIPLAGEPKHMIAIAHYSCPGDVSGVTTFLGDLVQYLRFKGHDVAVQLHHFGNNPTESEFRGKILDMGAHVQSIVRPRFTEQRVTSTLNFLAEFKPKIFLPQCLVSHFYAAAIAGDQGLPWLFTIHSDDPDYWIPFSQIDPTTRRGRVIAVSQHIQGLVKRNTRDPSSDVIPYGVSIPCETTYWRAQPFRIIFSGRVIEQQKRISRVIDTMIRACQLSTPIECRIIGGGPELEACRQRVLQANMGNRISFAGQLPVEQVYKELLDAQAILFMSDYEGLPVALLEAMARGVVPVARSIPSGIPEVVRNEETGLLIDDNVETAAKACVRLANSKSLWESCSRASRSLVVGQYSDIICHDRWNHVIETFGAKKPVQINVPQTPKLPKFDPSIASLDPRVPTIARRLKHQLVTISRRISIKIQRSKK